MLYAFARYCSCITRFYVASESDIDSANSPGSDTIFEAELDLIKGNKFYFFKPEEIPLLTVPFSKYGKNTEMETLAQQEFKKDNINLNQEIVKEIYDLNGNPIAFESENNNKCYIIEYLDKKLELPMDNSPVICIFDSQGEIEVHLLKLLNTDPTIIKDKISSICKNPDNLQTMREIVREQNAQDTSIGKLLEQVFKELEEKFRDSDVQMEETSPKEIASIEKFIKDLLNKYPDNIDLIPGRSVLIKSAAKILSPSDKVWSSQRRFTHRSLTIREINSLLGKWRRGNRFHTIQEINSQIIKRQNGPEYSPEYEENIIKMHLELLKNECILAENIISFYPLGSIESFSWIDEIDQNIATFYLFCLHGDLTLREYIYKNPKNALSLINQYIDKIPALFGYIRSKGLGFISTKEGGPDLIIDHLDKLFAKTKYRSRTYYDLKDLMRMIPLKKEKI